MGKPTEKLKSKEKTKESSNSLTDTIKDSDQAILITAKRGNVEVLGIKNTNYAHEAKGLIHGALDTYSARPVTNAVNSYTDNMTSHIKRLGDELKKALGLEVEEKQPEVPVPSTKDVPRVENKDKAEEEKPDEKKEQEENKEV